jgi:DNA primase catalytic core
MVPICRDTGSVVAFGGRAMNPDQTPKYLNSSETAIYSKARTLYGLHVSKASIRKLGYAVLVEGYFDFAQVFQTEAAPAVASCGTALTPQQAQLLRRFTTRVVLSFDPDAAGQGAATRSCELLVSEGFEVNVVVLDKGEDPDTFIRRKGPAAYRERLRTSPPPAWICAASTRNANSWIGCWGWPGSCRMPRCATDSPKKSLSRRKSAMTWCFASSGDWPPTAARGWRPAICQGWGS